MATTATDDYYSTPNATDLVVGQELDFQQSGTAAQVIPVGLAGGINTGPPEFAFNQQGFRGEVLPSGVAGDLTIGFVSPPFDLKAEVTSQGFAGDLADTAPIVSQSIPTQSFTDSTSSTIDLSVYNIYEDGKSTVTYTLEPAVSAPLSFNTSTGELNFTDTGGDDSLSISRQLRATDAVGTDVSNSFTIEVVSNAPAEADWQSRSNQEGVVWFHDFRSDTEVDQFRWVGGIGNDPGDTSAKSGQCVRNPSEGITPGCLELIYPVGNSSAPGWWRPMARLSAASSGKAVDDPGANGSLPIKPWDTSNAQVNEQFRESYYAHPREIGVAGFDASKFDGHEFWIQFRVKIDAERYLSGTPSNGKLLFLATTQQTLNQEIVKQNRRDGAALWYTNFGDSPPDGGSMGGDNPGDDVKQPGGPYSPACGTTGGVNGCWASNPGEWTTWLYHVIPGENQVDDDTLFEAYAARQGATKYELIFSARVQINFSNPATAGHARGYNAFHPSNYMNGQSTTVQWSQFYDQIIQSKYPIRVPWDDQESALKQAADGLAIGQSVNFTPNTTQKPIDIQWNLQTIFYDELQGELQYMGKPASGQPNGLEYSHYLYDERTDTWTDIGIVQSASGHVWSLSFDHSTGDYYWSNGGQLKRFRRRKGVALSSWETLTGTSDLIAGGIGAPILGWHPNLFGPGKPGLYAHNAFYGLAWNPDTDSWSRLNVGSWTPFTPYREKNNGQAIYLPNSDRLALYGRAEGDTDDVLYIHAGAGLSSDIIGDGLITIGSEAPIIIRGSGNFNVHGHIVQSPTDRSHLYCLREHGASTVWKSEDEGDTWVLKSYTHPFNDMVGEADEWTVGTIFPYGCIVGMSSNSSGGETVLWKPDD